MWIDATILADGGNSLFGLVLLVIFILLWGAGATSAIKSAAKKNQTPPRPMPPRLPPTRAVVRTPPPLPGIPQQFQRQVQRSPLSPSGAPLPPLRTRQRGKPIKAPPLPLPAARPAPQPPQRASIAPTQTPITRPAAPARSSTRSKIAGWLTPQTLRSQFILTEALRPPAALREDTL